MEEHHDIVLKDRDGNDVVYPTHTIRLKTSDGAIKKFVNMDSVPVPEEVTVDLDFSAGGVEIELLPLTHYSDFKLHTGFGVYGVQTVAPYTLTVGEIYFVDWDGEVLECVARDAGAVVTGMVYLGNGAKWGLPGNGEKFVIGTANNGYAFYSSVADTEPGGSCSVRIYQVTEGNGTSDMEVIPEDGSVFSKVTVRKPDTLVPENIAKDVVIGGVVGSLAGGKGTTKEIEPDFSAGNQTVTAGEDELWDEVIIRKPGTLVPENILDGVNIAGVVGNVGGANKVEPCIVLCAATSATTIGTTNAGSRSISPSVQIPAGSRILTVMAAGNYHTQSNTTNLKYAAPRTPALVTNYTETAGERYNTITWTYSISFTKYGSMVAVLAVNYEIPGILLKTTEDGLLLSCDSSVVALPSGGSFQSIQSITEVDLQDSTIIDIPIKAFYNARKLLQVTFPSTLQIIEENAFAGCYNLKRVDIPYGTMLIGKNAFSGCTSLTDLTLPDSAKLISSHAFYNCIAIKWISIPFGTTSIYEYTFYNCQNATFPGIPDTITTIGQYAFYQCRKITTLDMPSGLTSIGNYAFSGCSALTKVSFRNAAKVPSLGGTGVFNNCSSSLKIEVPSALYDTWIAASNWSTYADKIVAV
jgi:hypothetical protein